MTVTGDSDWYQHQPSEPGAVSTSWRPSHTITLSVLPFWSHWHVRVCHTDHIHLSHPIGPLLSDPLLLAGVDHMMWRCWVLNSLTGCHWLVFCLLTVTDRIHQSRQSCRAWQSPSQYLLTQYFVMTDDTGDNWCLPWDIRYNGSGVMKTLYCNKLTPSQPSHHNLPDQ